MSTVIKANQTGHILRRLSTVDLADHLAEARSVIEDARQQATGIVAEAKRDAARALVKAKQSGQDAGYKKGIEEGRKAGHQAAHTESVERFDRQQEQLVAAMREAITGIDALKEDLRIAAERDVLEFAVMIASKLTFDIGRSHREAAVENLKRALRLVSSKTDVTIRVHPDDIASMKTFAASTAEQAHTSRSVEIVPDESFAPGGCVLDSDKTNVDARLETQVEEIVSLLLGREFKADAPSISNGNDDA